MRHGLRVDAHCDEIDDEQSRFVEVLATQRARSGLRERVTASHTTAMGSYNAAYSYKLRRILSRAGINLVCNPMVNLHLQGRLDGYPKRRGPHPGQGDAGGRVDVTFGHRRHGPLVPARYRRPAAGRACRRARGADDLTGGNRGVLPDGDPERAADACSRLGERYGIAAGGRAA